MSRSEVPSARLSPAQAFAAPLSLIVGIVMLSLLGPVRAQPALFRSFVGVGILLAIWAGALLSHARLRNRVLRLEVVLRRQHYIQACAQIAIFVYWGWYWRPVYESAHLIVAQLLFAYAFDMLLVWSRRDSYTLGFGPFPVILSINLFFWFRPDWFVLQFLMVALGFAVKELIRWSNDRRRVHVFNPSSFPLAVFSLALVATGTSDVTWGQDIAATQFYPPHIYTVLFLLGLPNGLLFGVASMTMSAVVTTYLFGLGYFALTGVYYFYDAYVPIAVFLGMHFLFTDPSTAPRTELGRIMFGVLYGLGIVMLYGLLGDAGLPTFYDKLLLVPVLNLAIGLIDRAARSALVRAIAPTTPDAALGTGQRNLVYVTVWTGVFVLMSATHAVGDHHPGQWAPFWQQACAEDRPYACDYLTDMQASFCEAGSGWGCNEIGILRVEQEGDRAGAAASFEQGCALGFRPACANTSWVTHRRGEPERGAPVLSDLPVVLRGSKGKIVDSDPESLYVLACVRGFSDLCGETTGSR